MKYSSHCKKNSFFLSFLFTYSFIYIQLHFQKKNALSQPEKRIRIVKWDILFYFYAILSPKELKVAFEDPCTTAK